MSECRIKDLWAQTDRRCESVCVRLRDLSGLCQMPSTCLESLSHPAQMHKAVCVSVCMFVCVYLKIKACLVAAWSRPKKGFSAVSHSG